MSHIKLHQGPVGVLVPSATFAALLPDPATCIKAP